MRRAWPSPDPPRARRRPKPDGVKRLLRARSISLRSALPHGVNDPTGHACAYSTSLRGRPRCPLEVLEQVRAELLDWQGCGISVMEVSHRGKPFMEVAERGRALLRELLGGAGSYRVLFLQGGATGPSSPRCR